LADGSPMAGPIFDQMVAITQQWLRVRRAPRHGPPVNDSYGSRKARGLVRTPRGRDQSAVICCWSERVVTSIRRGFAFSATGMTTVSTPAS
jgi:hypothetical protein